GRLLPFGFRRQPSFLRRGDQAAALPEAGQPRTEVHRFGPAYPDDRLIDGATEGIRITGLNSARLDILAKLPHGHWITPDPITIRNVARVDRHFIVVSLAILLATPHSERPGGNPTELHRI